MENSQFVTDAEITRYLNESISEEYDLIIESAGQEFFLDTYTFSTVSNQDTYSLPSDFYILKGVDASLGGPDPLPLKPYMFNERWNNSIFSRFGWGRWGEPRYRLMGNARKESSSVPRGPLIATVDAIGTADGLPDDFTLSVSNTDLDTEVFYPGQRLIYNAAQPAIIVASTDPANNRVVFTVDLTATALVVGNQLSQEATGDYLPQIRFTPTPTGATSITIWYIPHAPVLVSSTDVWNGFNGWEEYAIVDAAIKCLEKEESDTGSLEMRKQRLIMRIQSLAGARDQGFPEQVTDVTLPYWNRW